MLATFDRISWACNQPAKGHTLMGLAIVGRNLYRPEGWAVPVYEYKCEACSYEFEIRVTMTEAEQVCCPKCGAKRPQRILSRFAKGLAGQDGPRDPMSRPLPKPTL